MLGADWPATDGCKSPSVVMKTLIEAFGLRTL